MLAPLADTRPIGALHHALVRDKTLLHSDSSKLGAGPTESQSKPIIMTEFVEMILAQVRPSSCFLSPSTRVSSSPRNTRTHWLSLCLSIDTVFVYRCVRLCS